MRLKLMVVLLCSVFWGQSTVAQNNDTVFAQEPDWMIPLAEDKVDGLNYHEIVQKFNEYRASLPNGGKKTPYNKHVLNFFFRWQKRIEPFVNQDGIIKLPSPEAYNKTLKRIHAASPRKRVMANAGEAVPAPWKVIAPFQTFDYQNKKAVPWQCNILRLGVAESNSDIIYCGTETGMIFKTTDKGESWKPCAPLKYFGGEISTVEVSKTNPDKVVIGANMNLWLTTDGGENWTDITPSGVKKFKRVRDAVFNPNDDNRIIMGSDEGVFVSEDNGQNWNKVVFGRCFDIKYKKDNTGSIYALVDQDKQDRGAILLRSTNNGTSFQKVDLPEEISSLSSGRMAVTIADPGYLYILACKGSDSKHPFFRGEPCILKSKDGGDTWDVHNIASQMNQMDRSGGQGYYDMIIAASPKNPEELLFGILYLYSSKDGGKTLDKHPQYSTGRPDEMSVEIGGYYGKYDLHTDMQDIHISETNGETWLTTDGGLVYSPDFLNVTPVAKNYGIYASEFWGFDQGWNEDVIVGGRFHNGNLAKLGSYGDVSIALRGSEHPTGYVFLSNPRKITFSDTQQKLLVPDKWTDEFKNFENADQFMYYPKESTLYGTSFEYDPRYAKSFLIISSDYSTGGMPGSTFNILWKTTDDGLSYTKLYEFNEAISSYAISRSNPDKIVVSTYTKIYYSVDGGETFQEYSIPQEMLVSNYRIAIHPTNENEIWAATDNPAGIWRTQDNGETWVQLKEGLTFASITEEPAVHNISRFFLTGHERYAAYGIANNLYNYDGTYYRNAGRVVYWDNQTQTWNDFSEGLPEVMRINRIQPFYKNGTIRIATENGVWERPLMDSISRPIAQPIILNAGSGENKNMGEVQFDSYSIVNQNGAEWEWSFNPEPISIDNPHIRNPKVVVAPNQSYDVTLTVTNSLGESDTKTVRKMIEGTNDIPSDISAQEQLKQDVILYPTLLHRGAPLQLNVHGLNGQLKIQVYDLQGKVVLEKGFQGSTQVQLPTLNQGIYVYKIIGKKFFKVGRFILQ